MIFTPMVRYLQKKRYQYEVTFGLSMLGPTEKLIHYMLTLMVLAMLIAAITLYLPQHVLDIGSRAWFYYAGDEALLPSNVVVKTNPQDL